MADIMCDICTTSKARYMVGDMTNGQQTALCEACQGKGPQTETVDTVPPTCMSCDEVPPAVRTVVLETGDASNLCLRCFVAAAEVLGDSLRHELQTTKPPTKSAPGEQWVEDADGYAEPISTPITEPEATVGTDGTDENVDTPQSSTQPDDKSVTS